MPAGRVALDTDVASAIWRGGEAALPYRDRLVGRTPVLTFITVAEMWQGAHHKNWGRQRCVRLREFCSSFAWLHCNAEVVLAWGRLAGMAMKGGHGISHNDCWIAASCVVEGVPLLTGNVKDFQPLVDLNLGLQLV
jgi:predicted nucleic acid-binding protein